MILDNIKFFARFPKRDGVLKNFNRTTSRHTGYDALKAEITALPAALIPQIEDYIFSDSAKIIDERIRSVTSFFMLFEYGAVQASAPNNVGARIIDMGFSVMVGYPGNKINNDVVEESLRMQDCFNYLLLVIAEMENENGIVCGNKRFNQSSFTISPVDPVLASGAFGWQLSFRRQNNTLL